MMRLYHSPRTRSARIVQLLNQLGDVPCEIDTRPFKTPVDRLQAVLRP